MRHLSSRVLLSCLVSLAIACGGTRDDENVSDDGQMGAPPAAEPAEGMGTFTAADVTPQMVALGDSIFEGKAAGGICYTCHGPDAKGMETGPNLTDQEWLHGDGSLDFIVNVVRNGVDQPKQFQAPMPPFRALLTDEQVRAVAAYVYSLSHQDVGR